MNHLRSEHRSRCEKGIAAFVTLVACSAAAGLVQKACWVAFLVGSGYGIDDLTVPCSVWLSYHVSALGLVLDFLIFGPWLVAGGWLWFSRMKSRRLSNQMQ